MGLDPGLKIAPKMTRPARHTAPPSGPAKVGCKPSRRKSQEHAKTCLFGEKVSYLLSHFAAPSSAGVKFVGSGPIMGHPLVQHLREIVTH